MANIRKSFNLRNGVQVDEDNLFVNSLGNVGLGTTVPSETLDVRGNIKAVGVVTAIGAFISGGLESTGVSTFTGNVHVGSAITMYPSSGIISATSFRGDGASLLNIPTSQWTDVDPSLNIVSIYNTGSVGIATTLPKFTLQIGGNSDLSNFQNGVGINSSGNMVVTGIVTAGVLKGEGSDITSLNASNIKSGIVSNAYLQAGYEFSGILTASQFKGNVLGDVVGFATTARDLVDGLDLSFGSFTSDNAQIGILTVTGLLIAPTDPIGVGTTAPQANIHVKKAGISSIQISSDTNESIITLSRGIDQQGTAGAIKFGNASGSFPYSEPNDLDIINYTTGSVNSYLHAGSTAGINTGGFFWLRGKNVDQLMTLTYDKKLGIGVTIPVNNLHVVGTSTVTSNAFIGNNLTVKNDVTVAGDMSVTGSYGLTDSDIIGLNINSTTAHSRVKNLDVDGTLKVLGITTISGFVAVGNTFSAGISNGHPTRGFGINIDLNNAVAIGTDAPFNDVGLVDLDVRHGKAVFAGVGVGTTALKSAIDFRFAGRNHADVVNKAEDVNRMYMYPPVVTTAERGNLVGMEQGAVVYDSDLDTICFYNGSAWRKVSHTAA
tara:strand:+ start:766 stop:2577 length:1812 start_codon:yes stop_codon:yes gene_type:complete